MAKTTTTKAQTKTTKKRPATKRATTTKKSTAKATTKKTVATKAKKPAVKASASKAAKPAMAVAAAGKSSKFAFLQRSHTISAGIFAILAVLAGFFMSNNSVQILLGHLTKDELASKAGTVLAPAAHVLGEVEFRWLLVGLLAISAVIALLRATRYNAQEEAGLKKRLQPARWIEFGITGAISFQIVALLNGMQDVLALKLSAVSILVSAYLAWVFERENAATGKPARAVYSASAVAVLFPVLALLATMYATYVYGMERSPWYAYAAAVIVSVYLLATVRMQWAVVKSNAQNYPSVNKRYDTVALVSKVALAAVLIVGLYK